MANTVETIDGLQYITQNNDGVPATLPGLGGRAIQDNFVELGARTRKNNFVATTDPGVSDDADAGYSLGSVWFNTTSGSLFIATDVTADAAVWPMLLNASVVGSYAADRILSNLTDAATARANLGLGTAAIRDTGTSGTNVIPVLSGANTWSAPQTFSTASASHYVAATIFSNSNIQPGNGVVLGHNGGAHYGAHLSVVASFTFSTAMPAATAGIQFGFGGSYNNTKTNTSGQNHWLSITPAYNQTSGTGANTDLLINRTQTAVGSGTQRLIDAQVGGNSMFYVTNTGSAYFDSSVECGTVNAVHLLVGGIEATAYVISSDGFMNDSSGTVFQLDTVSITHQTGNLNLTSGTVKAPSMGIYATNAAALLDGKEVGEFYRTATGEVRVVC